MKKNFQNSPRANGLVVWLFGLSGAGKSTIAKLLQEKLSQIGIASILLDGDSLREGINKDLSFSLEDRAEGIRRASEIAKIMIENQMVAICSFITPLEWHRQIAARILGDRYFDVFVDCPLKTCEKRDVKGLYEKARKCHLPDFTGISSVFETPINSKITLKTDSQTPEESCILLFDQIIPIIQSADIKRVFRR